MRGYVELRRQGGDEGARRWWIAARHDVTLGRPGTSRTGPGRLHQCLSSTFFGFGGDGTFAYWNAGVAFSASFVAPGR